MRRNASCTVLPPSEKGMEVELRIVTVTSISGVNTIPFVFLSLLGHTLNTCDMLFYFKSYTFILPNTNNFHSKGNRKR